MQMTFPNVLHSVLNYADDTSSCLAPWATKGFFPG